MCTCTGTGIICSSAVSVNCTGLRLRRFPSKTESMSIRTMRAARRRARILWGKRKQFAFMPFGSFSSGINVFKIFIIFSISA